MSGEQQNTVGNQMWIANMNSLCFISNFIRISYMALLHNSSMQNDWCFVTSLSVNQRSQQGDCTQAVQACFSLEAQGEFSILLAVARSFSLRFWVGSPCFSCMGSPCTSEPVSHHPNILTITSSVFPKIMSPLCPLWVALGLEATAIHDWVHAYWHGE